MLIESLLFLDGLPRLELGKLIGETVPEILECDLHLELEAPQLREAIAIATAYTTL
jgi:bacterioferritin